MARSKIQIHSDWSEVLQEFDRIEAIPDEETVFQLDLVLEEALIVAKADTHVITGSLQNSGRAESRVDQGQWIGEISFGGLSDGFPHNPVRYAVYEQDRGGDHDFLRNLYLFQDQFEEVIANALRGDIA